ncbi:GNAT family N-acetyltransferase [Methylobacterium radiodurans]|uniref:N-acetyltransferase n=1 Tax=Methylobacterium radiodurans TaxID=2202828 RepID=A0A2U8VZH3_9HYPH|nr:GNAT family N-acetyltransferase [Methylobacterium radiodurans]AWN39209.1 N-acetyltransferase [Methylobacterium radiodurans]
MTAQPLAAASVADPQARWRDLVDRRLPEAARARPDWPVRRDHGFARVLLDNACGGPWRESVCAPAWANMPPERLALATELGEALLSGRADLHLLNRRSLLWRGKERAPPAPDEIVEPGGLLLRRWRRGDDAPFAALNADPAVMAHFPSLRSRAESLNEARAFDRRFEADGFGPWAVEEAGRFVGFVGALRMMRPMPFPDGERPGEGVEIGWRLAREAWGRGIATRAARAALADLFGRCGVPAVVAYTAEGNLASRRVMERLGMRPDGAFAHPAIAADHPLSRHILYRLAARHRPGESA